MFLPWGWPLRVLYSVFFLVFQRLQVRGTTETDDREDESHERRRRTCEHD